MRGDRGASAVECRISRLLEFKDVEVKVIAFGTRGQKFDFKIDGARTNVFFIKDLFLSFICGIEWHCKFLHMQ